MGAISNGAAELGGAFDLAAALERMVAIGASDLLLKAGSRPLARVDGELDWLDSETPALDPRQTERLLYDLVPATKMKDFEQRNELEFAYSIPHLARFRISAYLQRGLVSIAVRVIPFAVRTIAELGLPDVVRRLAEEHRGVILVTGTTGCGKSTTLAGMIKHINMTARKHVVTIEDPIEYLHRDEEAAIDQLEVGSDTTSFVSALRHLLRHDPDVILIGEMRDEETVRTALAAAETGHLVLSTLHTLDAGETINRIIDFFPLHQHQHVRAMLAGTLKGIISQRLAPRADGSGRVPICEVLTMTGRVHDAILDPATGPDLRDVISEGEYYGMQTFDQALYAAVMSGLVAMDDALLLASHPHDFRLLVSSEGRTSTTMRDVPVDRRPR